MPLNIVVFYGSVRSQRLGIRAARFIVDRVQSRGHTVTLIDPMEHPLPLLDKMYKEYPKGQAPATLQKIADTIIPADGYIVVSGEYNHNVPPALSNLLDHFLEEYFYKPSGIVCYSAGSFGGVRAAIALRSMLAEMGMSSVPSILPVPRVHQAFDERGNPTDDAWHRRADKFLGEFEWYAHALAAARRRNQNASLERSNCDGQSSGPTKAG